jgi:peptidoglycan/xylan/chitin deacetylase (PgdA/CDA1 family)
VQSGEIDRPYVSFSYDDGFRDNVRAARVLKEFGTTGCFFVCPAVVEDRSREQLAAFAKVLDFPVLTPLMSWEDMEKLVAEGHEIGGHTMTHPDLATVSKNQLQEEIGRYSARIIQRLGKAEHFDWPRGRWINFSAAARDAVFAAGFISCSSAVRGCHVTRAGPHPADLCIRRDHIFANWPVDHVRYLLAKNARRASEADNRWPADYRQAA